MWSHAGDEHITHRTYIPPSGPNEPPALPPPSTEPQPAEPFPVGRTVILLGDSLTSQNGQQDASNPHVPDKGYFNWSNALLGQAFDLTYNAGVGGERSDHILARVETDVIARKPDWTFVLAGANDLGQNVRAEVAWGNIKQIWQKLLDANIKVVALTVPRTVSMTNEAEYQKLNEIIRMEGPRMKVIVADAALYSDPEPYTIDGVHLNARGAFLIGQSTARAVRVAAPASLLALDAEHLTGTGGSLYNGATGEVADGWILTRDATDGAVSGAKVGGSDGEWQHVNLEAGGRAASLYRNITDGWQAGDVFIAVAEVEVGPGVVDLASIQLQLSARTGSTIHASSNALFHESTAPALAENPGRVVLRTVPFVIPKEATTLTQGIKMHATAGAFRVGRVVLP